MDNKTLSKWYLIIALFIGTTLVFVIPPFKAPDETQHFFKSYAISTGQLFPVVNNGKIGMYLPKGAFDIGKMFENETYLDTQWTYDKFFGAVQNESIQKETEFVDKCSTSMVAPFVYVIPSIGILITKLMLKIVGTTISVVGVFYGARFFSLLAYSIITFLCIRKIPKFQASVSAICLMPMTVYLYSSVHYDPLLIVATLGLLTICLNLRYTNAQINMKYLVLFSIILLIFINCKILYSFNLVLLLLIPKEKLKGLKNYLIPFLVIIGGIVLVTIICKALTNPYIEPVFDSNTQNTPSKQSQQTDYVISHPLEFIKTVIINIVRDRFYYISGTICCFGSLTVRIPHIFYILFILYLISLFLREGDSIKIPFLFKILFFVASLTLIGSIFLVHYISWTPLWVEEIGGAVIEGVQGRYFIPIMFVVILLFARKKHNDKIVKYTNIFINNLHLVSLFLLIPAPLFSIWYYWM